MSYSNVIDSCLIRAFTTKGRASVVEYWRIAFCAIVIHFIIHAVVWVDQDRVFDHYLILLTFGAIVSIHWFAVAVRRMHDTDNVSLWGFFGVLSSIVTIYMPAIILYSFDYCLSVSLCKKRPN